MGGGGLAPWEISLSVKVWDVDPTLETPRNVRATGALKRSPQRNFMLGHSNGLLEVMEGFP